MQENKIVFESFFTLGYYKTRLPNLNYKDLIDYLYNLKKTFPSQSRSNQGGYQSSDNLHLDPFFYPLVYSLNQINYQILGCPNNRLSGMWANISSYGHYNSTHTHGTSMDQLSGVLYLQVPKDSGRISFKNPLNINASSPYQPVEGEVLIFPQIIPHRVEPNLSQEDRISIAFNYE